MAKFNFGTDQLVESINLENQVIDAGVSILDPVWFDISSTSWKKSDNKNLPKGVYQGLNIVILAGKFLGAAASFVIDTNYYLNISGGLTILRTATFVGRSISDTILLVDIDTPTLELLRISGYSAGGRFVDIIDKLTFASSTNASIVSTLSASINNYFFCGYNSNIDGYISGEVSSTRSDIQKINFSTDSSSVITGLVVTRRELCGFESNLAGYITGGWAGVTVPSPVIFDSIEKLNFSTDINSTLSGQLLVTAVNGLTDSGYNSEVIGFTVGGSNVSVISTINKLRFSVDSNSLSSTSMVTASALGGGFESLEAGYYVAGNPANGQIEKFVFAVESNFQLSQSLSQGNYGKSGYNSSINGYAFGGERNIPPVTKTSLITELKFSDDSNVDIAAVLSTAVDLLAGFEN